MDERAYEGHNDAEPVSPSVLPSLSSALASASSDLRLHGGSWCIESTTKVIERLSRQEPIDMDTLAGLVPQCEDLVRYAWQKLHSGYWKDVPLCWRAMYSIASLLFALCSSDPLVKVKQLDLALLMGLPSFAPTIHPWIETLHATLVQKHPHPTFSLAIAATAAASGGTILSGLKETIPRIAAPSLLSFFKTHFSKNPVIITEVVNEWPALADPSRRWADFEYLYRVAGFRTVPIEIGGLYTDTNWGQALMFLHHFIDTFLLHTKEPENPDWQGQVGYLAQTELFDQIRALRKDIIQPDYTACRDPSSDQADEVEDPPVQVNAWFGPVNTISPCHFDPDHNLLCQVFGSKLIRLYSPVDSAHLYPHPDRLLFNTSQVDVAQPDLDQFPLIQKAVAFDCILRPGEMLYIPPKWWHYVRSLETSFSVSWWWS